VFQVQASVGVVALNRHSTTPADAMRDADTACYVAKATGRGRAQLFDPNDPGVRALRHEMHWASRVEQALAQDQLTLTWQRIVPLQVSDSLASQAPFKAEILLRMQDDDGSLISPGLFLPACERFFLAVQVDRWVLEHMLAWLTEHGHLLRPGDRLAVNLSGQSISDETFRQHALGLLRLAGARVSNLMLEVTETAAVNNLDAAKPFFEQVRAMGMLVALDDFGSGMSSFRYLRELPSDVLKIDGQFIRNIEHDEVHALSVRSMCELARATGQRTVAEWVESASIATFLTRLGVDHAQGFHFHRPEPLTQLAPLLASLGDRTTGNG
jgi:EAL domain-containing protein (putative c-di-GMP-specific phosphodiesterase class I)